MYSLDCRNAGRQAFQSQVPKGHLLKHSCLFIKSYVVSSSRCPSNPRYFTVLTGGNVGRKNPRCKRKNTLLRRKLYAIMEVIISSSTILKIHLECTPHRNQNAESIKRNTSNFSAYRATNSCTYRL